jgi:hypothetical protein
MRRPCSRPTRQSAASKPVARAADALRAESRRRPAVSSPNR